MALVTTPHSVCWTSFSDGNPPSSLVACAAKDDGHVTEFLRDRLAHPGLVANATDLFWSTDVTASIDRAPLGGGAPTPVVTTNGPHGRFLLVRGTLYWLVDSAAGSSLFAAGTDGVPSEVANVGQSDTDLLAIDDYSVYDYAHGFFFRNSVERLRIGSGDPPENVAGHCFYPVDITVGGGYVVWSCAEEALHWAPQIQSGAEHLEHGAGFGFLATWRELVYATTPYGGRVLRIDPATSKVDVVAAGLTGLTRIAVDDSGIYVGVGRMIRRVSL
jgi:hypothetical protein